ncbi:MAG: BACON domain-containing protein, partial [Nitrospiraceae bacterium]
ATQGAANPTNQNVTLTNTGGTLNWTASDNTSWLSVTPGSGSGSGTLTASVNTAGLAAGTYNGTITVTATGAPTNTVGVTLTVNPPATSSAILAWNANTEPDIASYRIYRSTTPGVYGAALATVPAGTVGYVATGLQVGTTYYFTVTAVDSSNNESSLSNEVSKSIF